jgi:hypothetical protein
MKNEIDDKILNKIIRKKVIWAEIKAKEQMLKTISDLEARIKELEAERDILQSIVDTELKKI